MSHWRTAARSNQNHGCHYFSTTTHHVCPQFKTQQTRFQSNERKNIPKLLIPSTITTTVQPSDTTQAPCKVVDSVVFGESRAHAAGAGRVGRVRLRNGAVRRRDHWHSGVLCLGCVHGSHADRVCGGSVALWYSDDCGGSTGTGGLEAYVSCM